MATKTKSEKRVTFSFKSKAAAERTCKRLFERRTVLAPEAAMEFWRAMREMRYLVTDGLLITRALSFAPVQLSAPFDSIVAEYLATHGPFVADSWVEHIPGELLRNHSAALTEDCIVRCLARLTDRHAFLEVVRVAPALRQRPVVLARLLAMAIGEGAQRQPSRQMAVDYPELWEAHRAELLAFLTTSGPDPVTVDRIQYNLASLATSMNEAELWDQFSLARAAARSLEEVKDCYSLTKYLPAPRQGEAQAMLCASADVLLKAEAAKRESEDPIDLYLRGKLSEGELRFAHARPTEWREGRDEDRRPMAFHPMFGPIAMRRW